MFALKILTGPNAGQIIPLKPGQHSIGRAPECQIRLNSNGVSKEHAQIFVTEDKIIIRDLNSRNGVVVNGVRISNHLLKSGDKVAFHDILVGVFQMPNNVSAYPTTSPQIRHGNTALQTWPQGQPFQTGGIPRPHQTMPHQLYQQNQGDYAQNMQPQMSSSPRFSAENMGQLAQGFFSKAVHYFDEVAMPGIYSLAQNIEYRFAILSFVIGFIAIVSVMSTFPMVSLVKTSIQSESGRRALTIARTMADANRKAIAEHRELSIGTEMADREQGVTLALIVSAQDGHIMAPARLSSGFSQDSFVGKMKRATQEGFVAIDDNTVGAFVPINIYNGETGAPSLVAQAIIKYDLSAIAMNGSQTFALLIQNIAIASLFGVILYLILMRLIEHPIQEINSQLDDALRESTQEVQTSYKLEALTKLTSNIVSALSRMGDSGGQDQNLIPQSIREHEGVGLVRMLQAPALVVSALDRNIISSNSAFDHLFYGHGPFISCALDRLPDAPLVANIRELIQTLSTNPAESAHREIKWQDGKDMSLSGQTIMGSHEPIYFVICLQRPEGSN